MSKTIYHMHHIVPKHAGGTDDPENLVKLTVEEHAEAHRKLYEEHGRDQDKLAWKMLSGQIGREEELYLKSSIGGCNNKGIPKSEEHKSKISESLSGKTLEKETKEKISDSMKGNTNSQNHSSEEYKNKQSDAMKRAWARRKNKPL